MMHKASCTKVCIVTENYGSILRKIEEMILKIHDTWKDAKKFLPSHVFSTALYAIIFPHE